LIRELKNTQLTFNPSADFLQWTQL
jgi:hypothetical protein